MICCGVVEVFGGDDCDVDVVFGKYGELCGEVVDCVVVVDLGLVFEVVDDEVEFEVFGGVGCCELWCEYFVEVVCVDDGVFLY